MIKYIARKIGTVLCWLAFSKQRHICGIREGTLAIGIGLAVFFVVFAIKNYSFYRDEDINVQDKVQKLRVDHYPPGATPPIVLIDFSQRDYHAWNYPPVAPRGKLSELIKTAAN